MRISEILENLDNRICCYSDEFVHKIIESQSLTHTGCNIVIDKNHKLVGIITDGDIRRAIANHTNIKVVTVNDIMNKSPKFTYASAQVSDVFTQMTDSEINQLPIVDDTNNVIGLVSYHNIAKSLSPEQLFINLDNQDLSDNELRHMARYKFARSFIKADDLVLDGACGSGYGSKILAGKSKNIIGIDLNARSINYAKKNYGDSVKEFNCSDIEQLNYDNNSIDVVVSFETLEHIPYDVCRNYLKKIGDWLKPGGILVASSPMLRFKDGEPYVTNPYHINELPKNELLNLFDSTLPNFNKHYYHQKETEFLPLQTEHTGFCIIVARKNQE
ncbi:methyltransferase domain-containing protein [Psychrobium sp. MM17-31]|uniref:methyltransferase domain-containing protein n=1 Tax=Psychrobium sp. MM17-31 TaxID=2917758 RepID=UPI001EF58B3C|nr:methyltransferase domain-containing protein [Psychrobium sp. MM17-31]MCG7530102.1 methyltransferase domain-containing protein [Psychrobium sp. MM17-31]